MTPKEKAEELFDRYETLGKDFTRGVSMREFAKQCALIAVDEIQKILYSQKTTLSISAYKNVEDFNHDIKYNNDIRIHSIFYFDMVKQEIEQI
jgi:hypothetical protein